jgi:hypothetical protein
VIARGGILERHLSAGYPTSAEGDFEARLRSLRASWCERREIARFAHSADAPAQLELLQRIHAWCCDCVEAVGSVYGSDLPAATGARPSHEEAAFALDFGGGRRLVFSLVRRSSGGWRVGAQAFAGESPSLAAPVGPGRRDGSWTRARVEDLVLAQVAAIERARGDGAPRPGITADDP